jgi:predicted  nucleic acid-binding Zn-ribbon protein
MNAIQCENCKEIYTANKPLILSECLVCGHKYFEEVEVRFCSLCHELYVDGCNNCDKYLPVTLDANTLQQYDLDEYTSGVLTKDHTLILDDGELVLTEEDLYDLELDLDLKEYANRL